MKRAKLSALIRLITLERALAALLLLIVAGCASATPTPDPNGPVLVGFDSLPKSLATISLSATPNAPQIQATVNSFRPTSTPPPPTFTPTRTPHVGIFMGASTYSAGNLLPTGTRAIVMVTFAPQPGTKIAANPGDTSSNSGSNCGIPVAAPFTNAARNPAVSQRLGCPSAQPHTLTLVMQPFQTGFMFWRDTKEIYVLSTAALRGGSSTDTFWRVPDNWNESMPASDPSQVAPAGLLQPIRGFGYVWRSNATIRSSLGWALAAEQPYQATWQDFEHGWMITNNNGTVLALVPSDGPPPTTGIHFGPLPG